MYSSWLPLAQVLQTLLTCHGLKKSELHLKQIATRLMWCGCRKREINNFTCREKCFFPVTNSPPLTEKHAPMLTAPGIPGLLGQIAPSLRWYTECAGQIHFRFEGLDHGRGRCGIHLTHAKKYQTFFKTRTNTQKARTALQLHHTSCIRTKITLASQTTDARLLAMILSMLPMKAEPMVA